MKNHTIHLKKKLPEPESTDSAGESFMDSPIIPHDWQKGALLNVRNGGESYVVTLHPEEYDPRSPERALHFQNSALCQDFVSKWYQREHYDARAR